MNTLGKLVTKDFFLKESGFQDLQAMWNARMNSDAKHSTPAHLHLAYAMLRGKDYRKGFTATTESKRHDGITIDQGLRVASMHLQDMGVGEFVEVFGTDIVKKEALAMLKLRLPKTTGNRLAEDAYVESATTLKVPAEKEKVKGKVSWLANMSSRLLGGT